MKRIRALSFAACALASACASDEVVKPAPTSSETPVDPVDAGVDAPVEGDAGPRIREVFTRNPFGRAGGNLLVDGDFELSILPEGSAGQNGWIAVAGNGGDASILGETGGLCRSGLRCGLVKRDLVLFARGTAAPGEKRHDVTVWAKPLVPDPERPCKFLDVRLLACDSFSSLGAISGPDAPEADGWCKFHDDARSSTTGACLYIEVGADAILDDATVLPLEGDGAPPPIVAETPAQRARLDFFRDVIHRKIRFGKKPLPDAPPPRED